MRFLKLQVVLLLVAVIAVEAVAFDIVMKNRAETELATQITQRVAETNGVQARIHSFPFVGRLLLSGKVAEVDVTAQHSAAGVSACPTSGSGPRRWSWTPARPWTAAPS